MNGGKMLEDEYMVRPHCCSTVTRFILFLLSYKCDPLAPVHLREGLASGQ